MYGEESSDEESDGVGERESESWCWTADALDRLLWILNPLQSIVMLDTIDSFSSSINAVVPSVTLV